MHEPIVLACCVGTSIVQTSCYFIFVLVVVAFLLFLTSTTLHSLAVNNNNNRHVHFALFFVMVFFVIQVLAMIHEASLQHSRWNAMDERIRHEESHDVTPSERKTILAWQSLPWYALLYHQIMGSASEQHNREETIFRSLRREFLLDRSLHEPFGPTSADKRLDDTFNFGRYLGLAEIHVLSHAIKVQLGTWGFFAFMTLAFYGVTYALGFEVKVSVVSDRDYGGY